MNVLLTALPAFSRQRQVISGSRPACTQSKFYYREASLRKEKQTRQKAKVRLLTLQLDFYKESL